MYKSKDEELLGNITFYLSDPNNQRTFAELDYSIYLY